MPRTVKKPYHHGDLRERLVAAGEQALQDLPLAEVTLREIARRAGVSHAAPKHHFASLGELLAEIAARGFVRFVAGHELAMAQSADPTAVGRLRAVGEAYIDFAAANPAIFGLMFGKQGECVITPGLLETMRTAWTQLETAVASVIGPAHARDGAIAYWSALHGFSMLVLERRLPEFLSAADASKAVIRLSIAGLKVADGERTER